MNNRWLLLVITIFSMTSRADFESATEAYRRNDYATAFEALVPLAEQGDARAQHVLGLMYKYGEGVDQDLRTSFSWYFKAATLEFAPAQFHTGVMLADGVGTPQDKSEAIIWLTRAAESGFTRANEKLEELNVNSVVSKRHDPLVPWTQSWNSRLPNAMRTESQSVTLDDTSFLVQLAAMSTESKASQMWDALVATDPGLFDGLSFTIVETGPTRTLYRLQAGPFDTIEAARYFCNQLAQNESITTGCMPVKSRN